MIKYSKPKAIIAIIQLPTDHTGDIEFANIISRFPRVILRLQKANSDNFNGCDKESYKYLTVGIKDAVQSLKPNTIITSLGLACTSMSFSLGIEETNCILSKSVDNPNTKITNIGSSIIKALNQMNITKISLLMPYTKELSQICIDKLMNCGFNIIDYEYFGLVDDTEIEQIDINFIKERAINVDKNETECVVLCCSGMRVTNNNFIDELEKIIGKPIITSTQAFSWDLLRLSGINDKISGFGKLFLES